MDMRGVKAGRPKCRKNSAYSLASHVRSIRKLSTDVNTMLMKTTE